MANNIALFKSYISLLDEVYAQASLTADLDGDNTMVQAGANANEIVIPKLSMEGLAAYNRNTGYVNGDVTLTHETVACTYDRGRKFSVDAMDNIETAGVAFGKLASEFIRTKVVPELDAYRFSCYASAEGVPSGEGALTTGNAAIGAIRTANTQLDEAEVPTEGRILYITPTLKGLIDDLDTTKSRAVMESFEKIIVVPQSRFYTNIKLNDGTTGEETAGGFVKGAEGKDINFMIIHKSAVIQYQKHTVPKIITPEANQASDGWVFGFRTVGIADVYDNKAVGVYVHKSTT